MIISKGGMKLISIAQFLFSPHFPTTIKEYN